MTPPADHIVAQFLESARRVYRLIGALGVFTSLFVLSLTKPPEQLGRITALSALVDGYPEHLQGLESGHEPPSPELSVATDATTAGKDYAYYVQEKINSQLNEWVRDHGSCMEKVAIGEQTLESSLLSTRARSVFINELRTYDRPYEKAIGSPIDVFIDRAYALLVSTGAGHPVVFYFSLYPSIKDECGGGYWSNDNIPQRRSIRKMDVVISGTGVSTKVPVEVTIRAHEIPNSSVLDFAKSIEHDGIRVHEGRIEMVPVLKDSDRLYKLGGLGDKLSERMASDTLGAQTVTLLSNEIPGKILAYGMQGMFLALLYYLFGILVHLTRVRSEADMQHMMRFPWLPMMAVKSANGSRPEWRWMNWFQWGALDAMIHLVALPVVPMVLFLVEFKIKILSTSMGMVNAVLGLLCVVLGFGSCWHIMKLRGWKKRSSRRS